METRVGGWGGARGQRCRVGDRRNHKIARWLPLLQARHIRPCRPLTQQRRPYKNRARPALGVAAKSTAQARGRHVPRGPGASRGRTRRTRKSTAAAPAGGPRAPAQICGSRRKLGGERDCDEGR